MKQNITQLKLEFESRLNTQNWLENIGKHHLNLEANFAPFQVKFAKFECLTDLLKSDEWTNIDLEIFAEICHFTDQVLKAYSLMDELAKAAGEILTPRKAYLTQKIAKLGLPQETYDYALFPMVLRAFQEFGVSSANCRTDFNTNLLKILNLGYLPCGWVYNEPQKMSLTTLLHSQKIALNSKIK
ncbi:hypothetical protein [Campylobacter sp.]|uniref:hypothetical protein n=1 Tax=Campylobacter sp. TaxID=205 RepID=UPI0027087FC4|nr:hypothetical protein [Campylobacter sp.]